VTTVLVVEPDEQMRRADQRVLATFGFDCRAVGTVPEVLAAMAADPPDIVLLEVGLDADHAFAVHRVLRGAHARLPAVILTTSHRDVFGTMLDQLGPNDDWIVKPWDAAELVARVRLAAKRVAGDARG
jgi:DNA-binding response OmpR family regulator